MGPEDLLRLAWEVHHGGRRRVRDSLLTLAVLESGPEEGWAELCRARLIADRPEHFLAGFATIAEALGDPRVVETRERLRVKHPRVRVERLLFARRVIRGPFLGRAESLSALVDDLAGPAIAAPVAPAADADRVRRDAPEATRGPRSRARSRRPAALHLVYGRSGTRDEPDSTDPVAPEGEGPSGDPAEFAHFYLSVLLAIACLLATVEADRKASREG